MNNNFTTDSPYQFNLNTLLFSLYSKANDSSAEFYNTTIGTTDMYNTVYGEYMCRGDIPMDVCQNCVVDATSRIASECPNNKEAIIWYDQCFLRYSNRSFFSTLQQLPNVIDVHVKSGPRRPAIEICGDADTSPCGRDQTYTVINETLNDAVAAAATLTGTKKFAIKEANFSSSELMYTLVQCVPDLSPQFCSQCLYSSIKRMPTENLEPNGRIQNPSCILRFGVDRFYYKGNLPPSKSYNTQELGRPSLTGLNCSESVTANAAYLNNLRSLTCYLNMSSNITNNNRFYTTIVGNKSHTIYGLFMCRGDVPVELCHECVNEGIKQLNSSCPSSKEAIIWFDMCMLRYSNRSFFSTVDTQPIYTKSGADMLQNQKEGFNRLLTKTFNDLVAETPKSVPVNNFATKKELSITEFKTLYTLAQCTPNLSVPDCEKCLQGALDHIKSCCLGKMGGQAMNPSCNLRFELYRFYNDSKSVVPVPPAYPPTPKVHISGNEGKHGDHWRTIIIAASSLIVISILVLGFGFYCWKKKNIKSSKAILKKNFGSEGATLESLQFNLSTIEAATNKFSIENRIGKGGFGEVYMGVLPDGSKIAVKRLSENSSQGLIEFKNEVLLIAKLQHRNLVALLGFCLKDQEKILIYEYVPNKSLDYFLFGSQKARELNWPERYKIIEGIARGIHYLHEHSRLKVIHRDLKPSNILLDDEMNPKISDFGMARMVDINETRGSTNRIVGTLGYMSPEYLKFGQFSEKSDVFSFGVIVLEIISGKNINSQGESHESQYGGGLLSDVSIVNYYYLSNDHIKLVIIININQQLEPLLNYDLTYWQAWKHWRSENLIAILDSNLIETRSHGEIVRCIHIGLLCVQGNPQVRPSMNKVVKYLSNDSMKLPIPHEPAFFLHGQMEAVETSRAMEDQLANLNQYSTNEISESVLFPR